MSKAKNLKSVSTKIKSQAKDMRQNIDSRLLELTTVSVEQVRNQWSKAAEKLDIDQNLPGYLVSRILEKAKNVRESIQADEHVVKALQTTRKRVQQVKIRAKTAGAEIVKKSPLKARSKKSKTRA